MKTGQVFVVDDWNSKITATDLGSNYFSGNTGAAESAKGLMRISVDPASNDPPGSRPGGRLDLAFNFAGRPATSFAGYFASLFGLTDTLVSLTGGAQPTSTTKFPGYFINTRDIYRGLHPLEGRTLETLEFDVRLETAEPVILKIELKDEAGFDVYTRRLISPNGGSWQTISLGMPQAFSKSLKGGGNPAGFDWTKVSIFGLTVERSNVAAGVVNPVAGRLLIDNLALVDENGQYPDLTRITDPAGGLDPAYRDAFLDWVRATSILYFRDWASTDPRTGGIVQDRSTFADLMSVGAIGFQLNAQVIAAERGYITRATAAQAVRNILQVLDLNQGPARVGMTGYKGFFYHFLGINGRRKQNFDRPETTNLNESKNTVELSTIDTALAIAGVVVAGRYFNGPSADETAIRSLAAGLYARVDWHFMLDPATNQFYLGWKPNEVRDDDSGLFGRFKLNDAAGLGQYSSKDDSGVEKPATLDFYTDEALLIALLAIGSPDPAHRCGSGVWDDIKRERGGGSFVMTYPGSLFTYQFGSVWIDTQALGVDNHAADPIDFFQNTITAIDATRNYTLDNPNHRITWLHGKGGARWSLSATEGPFDRYFAYGALYAALALNGGVVAPPALVEEAEHGTGDGVIQPRGAASGLRTVWLHSGESRSLTVNLPRSCSSAATVTYSNDNNGALESVGLLIDGQSVGIFAAQDTGNYGSGWNVFLTSEPLGPVTLAPGPHLLALTVSDGDGYGVEIDKVTFQCPGVVRDLEDGTVAIYAAGSAILHRPDDAIAGLWEAQELGLLHPRFGFADSYNMGVEDALLPGDVGLRETGFWANPTGFGIDHGPMVTMIDNALGDNRIPHLFMSHPDINAALIALFPTYSTYTLTTNKAGTGSGTVGGGGNYAAGTPITLTADAATGSAFTGWSPSPCAPNFTMPTADLVCSATFTLDSYILTVTKSGTGSGTVTGTGIDCGSDCGEPYASGTAVTLTSHPSSDSRFAGWSGACVGTKACTVTMSAARSVTAIFTLLPKYTLTVVKSGSGTVTSTPAGIGCGTDCSESYVSGTAVALTPAPATGYVFSTWNGACRGSGACNLTMTAAKSVTATFTGAKYPITATADPAAGGTVTCTPNPVLHGASSTCTATPKTGYTLTAFSGACTGTSCALTNVTEAKGVTANFGLKTYPITATANPVAGGTVTCTPNPVPHGSGTTCTAAPNVGYTLSAFTGCTRSGTSSQCALTGVTAAKSVIATFSPAKYPITATPSPLAGGTVTCTPNPVSHGTSSTCTARPKTGYAFAGFSGACTGASCVLNNVTAAQGVTANFTGLTLRIDDVSRVEGNLGTSAATFTVTLSAVGAGTVTVRYATANVEALAGSDYTAAGGTLAFLPGQTSKTLTVNLRGDTAVESDETFVVNLSAPAGATLLDKQGLGTIRNDD